MKPAAINQPLQGLRGISILLVFASHWYAGLRAPGLLSPSLERGLEWMNSGKYGVEVFFMISGFVIVKSLRRHRTIGSFFIDRIARIYPLFLFLHLVMFVIGPLVRYKFFVGVGFSGWMYRFVVNLLLLPGVFDLPLAQLVAWSLSYEMAFYGIAACYVGSGRCGSLWQRRAGLLCSAAAATAFLVFHPRAIFFLPGVVAALWTTPVQHGLAKMGGGVVLSLAGIGLFLFVWPKLALADGLTLIDFGFRPSWWLMYAVGIVGGAVFFWHVATTGSRLAQFLGSTVPARFGDLSYSFYLWHLFVVAGLRPIYRVWILPQSGPMLGFVLFGIAALLITTLLSKLSREWLELWAGDRAKQFLRQVTHVSP